MKLYYSAGACSLSPHIVLEESGLAYEALSAPTKTHKLEDGTDYYSINPLGYVPYLRLDDGRGLHDRATLTAWCAADSKSVLVGALLGPAWAAYRWLCQPSGTGAVQLRWPAAARAGFGSLAGRLDVAVRCRGCR